MSAVCVGCGREPVKLLLELGPQPPSNRLHAPGAMPVERHDLTLGQCTVCALLQLVAPMPVEAVRPRFDWIAYNEAEAHLDDLTSRLLALPGLPARPVVMGTTAKDDTLLARIARVSGGATSRPELARDWGVHEPLAQIETLQRAVTPERASAVASRLGRADLLVARHVLEHAHDPRAFLAGLRALVKPGGWLLFELPGMEKALVARDHSFLWEEHVMYFTRETFARFFRGVGLPSLTWEYAGALEDTLVAAVPNTAEDLPAPPVAESELAEARAYAAALAPVGAAYRARLAEWHGAGRRIVVFGAGHLAVKFVNFHGLGPYIHCFVDDSPHKQGLCVPGAGVPIRSSAVLDDPDVSVCLLSVNPEREAAVLSRLEPFTARGGVVRSIYRASPRAFGSP